MRPNHGNVLAADFGWRFYRGYAFTLQAFHFLRVVNQGPERAHRGANFEGVLNHFHGALNAKTKPEFVS
jgi:hypothetical protein